MPRFLSEGIATYLALTGEQLKAPELLHTGLATHYVPSSKLNDLEDALVDTSQSFQDRQCRNGHRTHFNVIS